MQSFREAGEGKLSFVLWIAVLIVLAMALFEWVPQRIAVAELEDFMVTSAQRAHSANPKQLKRGILDEAKRLQLPLDKKNLEVTKVQGVVTMKASYTLELEFPFYTYVWNVEHDLQRSFYVI